MKELSQSDLREEINSGEPVLIKAYAPWCGPCKAYTPVVESVVQKMDTKAYSMNIDECPELTKEFNIRSIPCTIIVSGGKVAESKTGILSESDLMDLISRHF